MDPIFSVPVPSRALRVLFSEANPVLIVACANGGVNVYRVRDLYNDEAVWKDEDEQRHTLQAALSQKVMM